MEKREMPAASIDAFVVPSVGNQGDTIAMSAQASSTISGASLTYTWDFGDGSNQSGVDLTDVSHAYTAPSPSGSPYVVTLTVTDGDAPASATSSITIDDVPPTISAGPSQTVRAGDTVQFNGSASDAGGPGQIASIQWDFNYNGSSFNADPSANGNLTPSHAYTTPGTYVVAMQATDQSGAVSQDFTAVTVKPTDALIVNAGADVTTTAGESVTLSASYSDPGGTVSSGGIAWDTNYNGSTFNPVVTGTLTPNVSFSTPGAYQVALQITDSTGASDISVLNVTVQPVSHTGPTATAGPDQSINEGSTAAFNGSYTDPDGTVSPQNIAWDFNYDGVSFNQQTMGTLTPTYQFTTPGDYTVALQITDSNGLTSLSTLNVTVNAVPPTVSAGSNLTVTAGQLVQFNGSASVPSGANDPLSYAWDFNYDGQNFNPGSANTLNPYQVFATPGTYTVALQATDSEGVSSLSTITVTVNASNALVVDAGPDQALNEGDTAAFSGSYTDGNGTVSASTAQWDFNYDGHNFVANPSANGTLTPSYQFTTPGTYLVALQLTDSNNVTSIGTMYVSVGDVSPTVDAGVDETVNQGATVLFAGSASVPTGANDPLTYAWDFDYDGNDFVAAPNSNTLTPTNVYTTPGTYEAALQVTDAYGQVSLASATITVNDVPPTATVSNSGPANVGSPVTFTVSHLQDLTPGDTPTYLVDWTGSGQFEELTSDEITTNPDGSISFTHNYDTPGSYSAVVQIVDGSGGSTNYTTNVVVNDLLPTVIFGPQGINGAGSYAIDATVPLQFQFMGQQLTGPQTTFTYYVSLDGGAYTSSSSPTYLLPSGISQGQHTLSGYVQDNYGGISRTSTFMAFVGPPQVEFEDNGSGQVNVNGTILGPSQPWYFSNSTTPLTVTLLTSNANYILSSNVAIASLSAASGVTNVSVTVSTIGPSGSMLVGDGHIGSVTLPGGNSTLQLTARGDLGSIAGPTSDGTRTGLSATDLAFANLTGSITGLDSIQQLTARGWLGTSASQEVEVSGGIGALSAYGVGAVVHADLRQDAGDAAMSVGIGAGGVPGVIDGGNVAGVQIAGNVNVFEAQTQEGNFDPPNVVLDVIENTKNNPSLDYGTLGALIFTGKARVNRITAGLGIGGIFAGSSLTVAQKISALSIGTLSVKGDLYVSPGMPKAGVITAGTMGPILVTGSMDLNGGKLITLLSSPSITVGGHLTARVISLTGNTGAISVAQGPKSVGWFEGYVAALRGNTGPIKVGGDFYLPQDVAPLNWYLVYAKGNVGPITAAGNIGSKQKNPTGDAYRIQGASIDEIDSDKSIFLRSIKAIDGDIKSIHAVKLIDTSIESIGGDIRNVSAGLGIEKNIRATASITLVGGSIWRVEAFHPLTIQIIAERFIGKVVNHAPANQPITAEIRAQGGAKFNPNTGAATQQALIVDAGQFDTFEGVIQFFVPPSFRNNPAAVYSNDTALLTLTDNAHKGGTTWKTVKAGGGNVNLLDAVFNWEHGHTPLGKQRNPIFSQDGWSISDPQK
ncbi:MAG TPA: PKD domain-containing protein [Gemmataceae bacterium]